MLEAKLHEEERNVKNFGSVFEIARSLVIDNVNTKLMSWTPEKVQAWASVIFDIIFLGIVYRVRSN